VAELREVEAGLLQRKKDLDSLELRLKDAAAAYQVQHDRYEALNKRLEEARAKLVEALLDTAG
jgi:predicted DNA-binding protein (UPF0251 family)